MMKFSLALMAVIALCPTFSFADAAADINVNSAWARATVQGARTAAAYVELENTNKEAAHALVGAQSEVARMSQLHSVNIGEHGQMNMYEVEQFVIPAGGKLSLAPGGHHIMLIGLNEPLLPEYEIPLTLAFADGSTLNIRVPVKSLRYMPEEAGKRATPEHQHHHH